MATCRSLHLQRTCLRHRCRSSLRRHNAWLTLCGHGAPAHARNACIPVQACRIRLFNWTMHSSTKKDCLQHGLPMANCKVHSPMQATPGISSPFSFASSQHGMTDSAAACSHAAPGPCQAAFCVAGKLAVTAADLQRGGVRWGPSGLDEPDAEERIRAAVQCAHTPTPRSRSACLQAIQCMFASWKHGGGAR